MDSKRMRTIITRLLLVLVLLGALFGLLFATTTNARADNGVNCHSQLWWTIGSTQRTICDGPIRADGTWTRWRELWTPAHRVPLRTNCYGYSYISCTTTGGYFQERTSKGIDQYEINPAGENKPLPDEPGHIN